MNTPSLQSLTAAAGAHTHAMASDSLEKAR